jgi:hypothetical protein
MMAVAAACGGGSAGSAEGGEPSSGDGGGGSTTTTTEDESTTVEGDGFVAVEEDGVLRVQSEELLGSHLVVLDDQLVVVSFDRGGDDVALARWDLASGEAIEHPIQRVIAPSALGGVARDPLNPTLADGAVWITQPTDGGSAPTSIVRLDAEDLTVAATAEVPNDEYVHELAPLDDGVAVLSYTTPSRENSPSVLQLDEMRWMIRTLDAAGTFSEPVDLGARGSGALTTRDGAPAAPTAAIGTSGDGEHLVVQLGATVLTLDPTSLAETGRVEPDDVRAAKTFDSLLVDDDVVVVESIVGGTALDLPGLTSAREVPVGANQLVGDQGVMIRYRSGTPETTITFTPYELQTDAEPGDTLTEDLECSACDLLTTAVDDTAVWALTNGGLLRVPASAVLDQD